MSSDKQLRDFSTFDLDIDVPDLSFSITDFTRKLERLVLNLNSLEVFPAHFNPLIFN
jgi:hypothetical protein